jgi:hypothetical protein
VIRSGNEKPTSTLGLASLNLKKSDNCRTKWNRNIKVFDFLFLVIYCDIYCIDGECAVIKIILHVGTGKLGIV